MPERPKTPEEARMREKAWPGIILAVLDSMPGDGKKLGHDEVDARINDARDAAWRSFPAFDPNGPVSFLEHVQEAARQGIVDGVARRLLTPPTPPPAAPWARRPKQDPGKSL